MRATVFLTISLLTIATTACVEVRALRPEISIQVQPSGPDQYKVEGNTNLPGKTNILVQAIRPLQPQSNPGATPTKPVYAIVARERVTTGADGKWQTNLKVLQAQAKGAPLESWQQNFVTQQLPLQADPNLNFIATTDPIPGNLELEGDVRDGRKSATATNPALQINIDGTRFLKAEQSLPIPAPTLPNQPTIVLKRQIVPAKVTLITAPAAGTTPAHKTTAPAKPQEFVR
jgi:hypothetical protein